MRILLTNDDGIRARGIRALADVLRAAKHQVSVVAPDREQSATSHSITLHRPLRIHESGEGEWAVDGTPTDCVLLAVNGLLADRPDVVVSGINLGPNMGEDVTYSGTVAAAFEAHILGIPSLAASMKDPVSGDFAGAARYIASLADRREEWEGEDRRGILNVNFPAGPSETWGPPRVTRLGTRRYTDELIEKLDPRGRKYYWIGGAEAEWQGGEETDFGTVHAGAVSVTPLHLDLTDEAARQRLTTWNAGGIRT